MNKESSHLENEPGMFFAFNNGITATAEDVEVADEKWTWITRIENLQIVNGGQSTASIHATSRRVDSVACSCRSKLMIVASDEVTELDMKYTEYSEQSYQLPSLQIIRSTCSWNIRVDCLPLRLMVVSGRPSGFMNVRGVSTKMTGHWFQEPSATGYVHNYPKRQLISN